MGPAGLELFRRFLETPDEMEAPSTVMGRGGGIRTPGLRIWNPLLCQLSYAPKVR